jgi:hypothetical protein
MDDKNNALGVVLAMMVSYERAKLPSYQRFDALAEGWVRRMNAAATSAMQDSRRGFSVFAM